MKYDEALAVAHAARQADEQITDETARALAAAWQSPGAVGWTLAAIASGAWTWGTLQNPSRQHAYLNDLELTFKIPVISPDHNEAWGARIAWAALEEWAKTPRRPDPDSEPRAGWLEGEGVKHLAWWVSGHGYIPLCDEPLTDTRMASGKDHRPLCPACAAALNRAAQGDTPALSNLIVTLNPQETQPLEENHCNDC